MIQLPLPVFSIYVPSRSLSAKISLRIHCLIKRGIDSGTHEVPSLILYWGTLDSRRLRNLVRLRDFFLRIFAIRNVFHLFICITHAFKVLVEWQNFIR